MIKQHEVNKNLKLDRQNFQENNTYKIFNFFFKTAKNVFLNVCNYTFIFIK